MNKFSEIYECLLRPPGGGIPTYSAGKGSEDKLQKKIYGKGSDISSAWKKSLTKLNKAKVALLGVPLDTGAGIRRGAAYGPRAVREALLAEKTFLQKLKKGEVVDLGDVFTNPHLLHDEMLSAEQIKTCQRAMYSDASESLRSQLSVSALSQVEQILHSLFLEYPHLKLFVIGGDHSVAWPVTKVLANKEGQGFSIVQPDAHTDLLSSRLGIKYCFGTWSFHANELLKQISGKPGLHVQLGIRQSAKNKAHWESTTGIKQFWAEEIRKMKEDQAVKAVISHLKAVGAKKVYFSNDIDGTDESEASATGTPVNKGLKSSFLLKIISALGSEFELIACDIMEIAPDLAKSSKEKKQTMNTASKYSLACLEAMCR